MQGFQSTIVDQNCRIHQSQFSTSGGSPGSTAPVDIASQFLSSISSSINFHPHLLQTQSGQWQYVTTSSLLRGLEIQKRFQPGASILKSVASRRLWRQTQAHSLSDVKSWKTTASWTHFKVQNAECAQSRKHFLCGMRLMHTLPQKHLDLDLHLIASRCLAHGPTKEFKQQRSDWIKSYSLKASDCRYTYLRYGRYGISSILHLKLELEHSNLSTGKMRCILMSNVGPQLWIKRIKESPHFQQWASQRLDHKSTKGRKYEPTSWIA